MNDAFTGRGFRSDLRGTRCFAVAAVVLDTHSVSQAGADCHPATFEISCGDAAVAF